jgi:hypothetical protein
MLRSGDSAKRRPLDGYDKVKSSTDGLPWLVREVFLMAVRVVHRFRLMDRRLLHCAAFVGYCVQSNFVFPWSLTLDGTPFPSTDLSPPEQWDALPLASKLQIIAFIGFLEFYSELYGLGEPHYTKGGKVGKYPAFKGTIPHDVPFNLFDPFEFSKNKSEESKARGLLSEINNGRLAMLGIFGFLCEQTIPGSVPLLTGIVKPYAGEVMAPFSADFTF